jgi:primosomal protein N' (replication factor Y)
MRALRVGVSRAREELEALAGVAVGEVWGAPGRRPVSGQEGGRDGDAVPARDKSGTDRASGELDLAVVVGTEAVLHRARVADAVAFLDFDTELLAPRMRAAEEALALLVRASRLVAGSAGSQAPPGRAPGRVLVQTRLPGHEVLAAAVSADPVRLSESERSVRQALRLPPFSALAVVSGAAADAYGEALREAAPPGVEVSGPLDGRWSVRAQDHSELCALLAAVRRPAGRLRVEVDPVRV